MTPRQQIAFILSAPIAYESHRRFASSVLAMIDENPSVFPTDSQRAMLKVIHRAVWKRNLSDTERFVLEHQ